MWNKAPIACLNLTRGLCLEQVELPSGNPKKVLATDEYTFLSKYHLLTFVCFPSRTSVMFMMPMLFKAHINLMPYKDNAL